ncbi:MAG: nuclear transport factor 2 family protein [Candidatus Electrothrix sp. YB6]
MNATQLAAVTTDPASKAVLEFLSVLETKKVDNLLSIWDENGIFELPFSHKGIPSLYHPKFEGRQCIYELFQALLPGESFKFKEIALYPMINQEYVFIEFIGDITQLDRGIKYTNRYCALAHTRKGKILLFREYFHAIIRQNFEASGF